MKKLLLTTTLISAMAIFQPAYAHEGEEEAVSKATTAQEALVETQTSLQSLDAMAASGKLDGIHEEIEKTETSIAAIKAKATVEGDKKTHLEAALKQLTAQLGKVHAASDAKDAEKTKAELKKAESALKLVENAVK